VDRRTGSAQRGTISTPAITAAKPPITTHWTSWTGEDFEDPLRRERGGSGGTRTCARRRLGEFERAPQCGHSHAIVARLRDSHGSTSEATATVTPSATIV
jgi:hypothetical protein